MHKGIDVLWRQCWRVFAFVAYWATLAFFVGLIAFAILGQFRDDILHSGFSHGNLLVMSGHGVFIIYVDDLPNVIPNATYMEHYYPPEQWRNFIIDAWAFGDLAHDGLQAPSGLDAFRLHYDDRFGIRSISVMLPLWAFGVSGVTGLILVYAVRRLRLYLVWRKTRPKAKGGAFPVELAKPKGAL